MAIQTANVEAIECTSRKGRERLGNVDQLFSDCLGSFLEIGITDRGIEV